MYKKFTYGLILLTNDRTHTFEALRFNPYIQNHAKTLQGRQALMNQGHMNEFEIQNKGNVCQASVNRNLMADDSATMVISIRPDRIRSCRSTVDQSSMF